MMFKIGFNVANMAQARAYVGRIEDDILKVEEVNVKRERVTATERNGMWIVEIVCSDANRLVQIVQGLYANDYI